MATAEQTRDNFAEVVEEHGRTGAHRLLGHLV